MGLAEPEKLDQALVEVLHHRNGNRRAPSHTEEVEGRGCRFESGLGTRTPCRLASGRRRRRRRRYASSLHEPRNLNEAVVCSSRAAMAEKLKCASIFQPPMCKPRRA
jgi:hypothetical protein